MTPTFIAGSVGRHPVGGLLAAAATREGPRGGPSRSRFGELRLRVDVNRLAVGDLVLLVDGGDVVGPGAAVDDVLDAVVGLHVVTGVAAERDVLAVAGVDLVPAAAALDGVRIVAALDV